MSDSIQKIHKENDQISVQYTKRPGCLIDMHVTVFPATCANAYKKALKEVRKAVSIPGFRKGKAPEEIIIKNFSKDIKSQLEQELCLLAFNEGVQLINHPPFSKNAVRKLSLKRHTQESGAEIHIEYESEPNVPTICLEDIHIDLPSEKIVEEKEIDEFIKRLRFLFSSKKNIEDRGVMEGDEVVLTTVRLSDNEPIKDRLFCSEGLMPQWLKNGILGMNLGETKQLVCNADANEADKKCCTVTIDAISECDLDSVSEDQLKEKMQIPESEDLRNIAKKRLEFEAKTAAYEKMRKQLRNELIRLYAFDLPQSLVEMETQIRFEGYIKEAKIAEKEKDAARKPFLDEVKRNLTCSFLLQPFFQKAEITCSKSDIFREFLAQTHDVPPIQRIIFSGLSDEQTFDRLMRQVVMKQIEEYLIEQKVHFISPQKEALKEQQRELSCV